MNSPGREDITEQLGLVERRSYAESLLTAAKSDQYLDSLIGMLGVQPG